MPAKYPSVTIRIDQHLLEQVDLYAHQASQTRSQYIKWAIVRAIDADEQVWEFDTTEAL